MDETHPLPARPLRGFLFDLVMAVVLVLGLSLVGGFAWAIAEGVRSGFEAADAGTGASAAAAPGSLALLWLVIFATGGTALILYAWRRRATPAERRASHAALRNPATWGWTLATAVSVFVGTQLLQWAMAGAELDVVPSNLPVIEASLEANPAFLLLFAAVLAPAYEELLFRRVLFGRLWAAGRPWLGMVLSSAVFAFLHEVPGTTGNSLAATVVLWLAYGAMGAAFAWVYMRTGTLWAAFGAHALHNLASVLLLVGGFA